MTEYIVEILINDIHMFETYPILAQCKKDALKKVLDSRNMSILHHDIDENSKIHFTVKEMGSQEIKYMKMEEAFECGDDDIPYIKGGFNDDDRYTKEIILSGNKGFYCPLSPSDGLSGEWQVIKAELKFLTAEESCKDYMGDNGWNGVSTYKQAYTIGFDLGDSNGQLKERLNHKKLVEWARSKQEAHKRKYQEPDPELEEILKGIKLVS